MTSRKVGAPVGDKNLGWREFSFAKIDEVVSLRSALPVAIWPGPQAIQPRARNVVIGQRVGVSCWHHPRSGWRTLRLRHDCWLRKRWSSHSGYWLRRSVAAYAPEPARQRPAPR